MTFTISWVIAVALNQFAHDLRCVHRSLGKLDDPVTN
jgi:hypothetical protein